MSHVWNWLSRSRSFVPMGRLATWLVLGAQLSAAVLLALLQLGEATVPSCSAGSAGAAAAAAVSCPAHQFCNHSAVTGHDVGE